MTIKDYPMLTDQESIIYHRTQHSEEAAHALVAKGNPEQILGLMKERREREKRDTAVLVKALTDARTENLRLRELVKIGADWMQMWLDENLCECEYPGHSCGRTEREAEVAEMRSMLEVNKACHAESDGECNWLDCPQNNPDNKRIGLPFVRLER